MNITILTDDREGNSLCIPEHGLSILIEHDNYKVLLDFGQTDRFLQNADKLGVDLENIDTVVLSHGHYDHANGLNFIKGKKIICHPDCFLKRYSKISGKYDGIGITKEELQKNNQIILSDRPIEIAPGIIFLGQISRENDFECKEFPTVLEDGKADELYDDSGIVIKTEQGIIVITGCAHSGICNTVEYAKKITGIDNVIAIVGGFHLREINNNLEKVMAYLENSKAGHLLMGHCTCDDVCNIIKSRLENNTDVQILGVGNTYVI